MDFSIRTATPAEQMYAYSQSSQMKVKPAASDISELTSIRTETAFIPPGPTTTQA